MADCAKAFPQAGLYRTPGVVGKQPELDFELLHEAAPSGWEGELDAIAVAGIPMLDELVLLHRATRTLVVTDIAFNVRHSDSWLTRAFMRINSAYGRFGPSRMLRLSIRDKSALRKSIDRILEWDFDRVIVTHGDVLESGGQDSLRLGYAWLTA